MSLSIDALIEYAKSPKLGLDEKIALAVRLAEEAATLLYLSHSLLGAIPHADTFAVGLLRDDMAAQDAVTRVHSLAHKLICDSDAPTVPDLRIVPVSYEPPRWA